MSDSNRRDFLKLSSLAGLGLAGSSLYAKNPPHNSSSKIQMAPPTGNMSGYSSEPIKTVRVGIIGLGMRGPGAVRRLSYIDGVKIVGLCDLVMDKTKKANKILKGTGHEPTLYGGSAHAWKDMIEKEDLDLVYITTPWEWHTPMAVHAMKQGCHAAVEVPAATTMEECWELVETSESTQKHCMMLENCCYDFFELLTLNMARQGFFGEIIHGEGAYIHDLIGLNFNKDGYEDMWRLKQNANRNGNLYPTHGLGPICQVMNINRGDRMDYLSSMSSNDFNMGPKAEELAAEDNFFAGYVQDNFRGNMNTTLVKTMKGKTIMIQHDVSSPRPYSRIHLVSGSKGVARKWPSPQRIATGHSWLKEEEMKQIEEKYTPPIVKKVGELAKKVGGHGGMDFMMDWRLIDCLRNGLPLDQDVYDAALWSSIAPLSEWSVANRSQSIDVPDFTRGNWKKNTPVDISLQKGGTTEVNANLIK